MTPAERLKEIENATYQIPGFGTLEMQERNRLKEDIRWLIARVKRLTEALEKLSTPIMIDSQWGKIPLSEYNIARKALEETE